MRVLTIIELMRLTRIELTDLLIRITNALPDLPEGSVERQNAVIKLSNIRWAADAARSDAVTTNKTLPVRTGRLLAKQKKLHVTLSRFETTLSGPNSP
jgi:hypothetical protein